MADADRSVIFGSVKTIAFIIFIGLSIPFMASNGGDERTPATTLSARIIDKYGEAVAGAKIVIRETGQTLYTDFEGSFKVQLDKKNNFTFQVDMIGFEPKSVPSSQLGTGELVLSFL